MRKRKPKPKPLSKRAESSKKAAAIVGRPVNRAAIVDAEIKQLAARVEVDFYAICERVIEARDGKYYERLGFLEIPAYRFNPVAGARFLALSLEDRP